MTGLESNEYYQAGTNKLTDKTPPVITVGVITHKLRLAAFEKLLSRLGPAIENYAGNCELVVGNNSGVDHRLEVLKSIKDSGLPSICSCTLVDSRENNIAIGRNLVIDATSSEWLAFIDDDEYPEAEWLHELWQAMLKYNALIVAGPIVPIYDDSVIKWIKTIDVHNLKGKRTGDRIQYAATGNFLIHLPSIGDVRLNSDYGKTGGSDTEFFLRLTSSPLQLAMVWAEKAVVYEDIPADKSTVRYTIKRCLSQGNNYKRVHYDTGKVDSKIVFIFCALIKGVASLLIAAPLVLFGHASAGDWVKRGFSNLGKLYDPSGHLY